MIKKTLSTQLRISVYIFHVYHFVIRMMDY